MARKSLGRHVLELAADTGLAAAAFAGPAAALVLPRLPQLGAKPLEVSQLRSAYRLRWASFGAAALALGLLMRRRRGPERRAALAFDGISLGGLLALTPRLYRTELGLTRVSELVHVSVEAAAGLLHGDAQVAGAFFNGRAVAYPVALLDLARPFVDRVGGVPIVPLCDRRSHASLALVSGLDGKQLDLVRLGTPDNHVLLYDRATSNAFRPLTGRVEAGPDAGARLPVRPLLRCSWDAWRTLHPDTELAWWESPPVHALLHRLTPHELTVRHVPEEPLSRPLDARLPPAERVFAVESGGVAHAFTRAFLKKHRVVPLRLADRRVAVLYDESLDVAQAFRAELDRVELTLRPFRGMHAVAEDAEENLWDVTGRCIKGRAYGRRLAQVPMGVDQVFWFAWAHFHPHTGLDGWAQSSQRYAFAPGTESARRD